ncbi:MAG: GNAT family N-acetyltransferase [Gammaproteobacteria bacterium]|nr:GNAT family N-acetyltransferase [Gammaproteobacteria bacterium]
MMDAPQITLKRALPEFDEGLYFARYLNMAAEGFFRFMLGRQFDEIVAKAYIQPNHDLSYQHVIFVELDGNIVGMFSGYAGAQHNRASNHILQRAAGPWNLRMRVISFLFAPMMRIIDSVENEDFYLQAIAVESNLQGKGIGSKLMAEVEGLARKEGSKRLALDVSGNNKNARKLYERLGFSVQSTWPKHLRIKALKFYRMVKYID